MCEGWDTALKRPSFKVYALVFGALAAVALGAGLAKEYAGLWAGIGVLFVLGVCASVLLSSFLLSPLFQTNDLLERLVRETLHELNAPLATIQTNAHLLAKEHQDPKSSKRLGRIKEACTNLYALYEQMEYYIKREIRLVKHEVFDAKEAVEACITRCSGMQRDLSLVCDLAPLHVKTDRVGFEQCVGNVLSNAYKYNRPKGWVRIVLRGECLSIEDGGIGMDEQTRFLVFDRYYQANTSASGYGIGLSMVKAYCDAEGIFITFVSKENRGTRVDLHLDSIATEKPKDAL